MLVRGYEGHDNATHYVVGGKRFAVNWEEGWYAPANRRLGYWSASAADRRSLRGDDAETKAVRQAVEQG